MAKQEKKEVNIEAIIIISLVSVLLIVLLISATSPSNKKYQVSNLSIKESELGIGTTYIVGQFKNNSNKSCKPSIIVKVTSGSFETEETITLDTVEAGSTESIEEICFDCENLTDASVKVKSIECE